MQDAHCARKVCFALVGLCLWHVSPAAAQFGSSGQTRLAQYNIHQDPNDPSSPVTWTVVLKLHEELRSGSDIAWKIKKLTITELDSGGSPLNVWSEASPPVGLWQVTHADPNNPTFGEFAEPPLLDSLATAADPNNADMDYSLEGVAYTPPPGGEPYAITGALTFIFILDLPEPVVQGDEDWVEIPETDYPPAG